MDIIADLGTLAFASRLKRLSDLGMQSTLDVYKLYNVDFEPRFFPLFYYLSQKGEASIMELADNLKVSHPAVIQIAKDLEKKGLILSKKSTDDARKRNLKISKKGKNLLTILQKIWAEIRALNDEIIESREHNIMIALKEIEDAWAEKSYLERFKEFHHIQ
jgi:DNA-binding MarR family transcriptional regulator